jgi:hypothetical protein
MVTNIQKSRGGTRPGAGRPKGSQNKTTVKIKEAVLEAFEKKGGVKYLMRLADEDPKTFTILLAKILPQEMIAEVNETTSSYVFNMIQPDNEKN